MVIFHGYGYLNPCHRLAWQGFFYFWNAPAIFSFIRGSPPPENPALEVRKWTQEVAATTHRTRVEPAIGGIFIYSFRRLFSAAYKNPENGPLYGLDVFAS